ncbi:hypothetical protein BA895_19925 [Humibacillus sp. DSM 29435]|uniref:hypothetical protein n=1 Tax=Humibacillus sp. DSM 29435 TaxID=1869167 RepID=UPI00087287FC|nr:hypothetical protein [Humibacillus sp. DSM 29435]OFE16160.1 hypothetical protein BA895_19925 [Humibacillus sp. DSM 29435]
MGTIVLAFVVATVINMALSGYAGAILARRRGLPLWVGIVPGGVIPWIGLVVPSVIRPTGLKPSLARSRGWRRLAGVGLAGLGLLGIVLSAFSEWATVSGAVNAQGARFAEQASGGPGDTSFGLVVLLLTVTLSAVLLTGHLWHGGLRFSLPGLFIAGGFASMTILAVIGSELVSDASSLALNLTAGYAEAHVELGLGAMFAVLGSFLLCVGWMVTMGGRTLILDTAPLAATADPGWPGPQPLGPRATTAPTTAPPVWPPTSMARPGNGAPTPMPGQPPAGW